MLMRLLVVWTSLAGQPATRCEIKDVRSERMEAR
jgi:hypothetical protein